MSKKQPTVFLSYSHKDQDIADTLIDSLERLNINYWHDKKEIEWGENWMQALEHAINEASVIVLLISPNFLDSKWTMFETGSAISTSKTTRADIIPIAISEGAVPAILRRFQMIDAKKMRPDEIANIIKQIVDKHSEKIA